MRLGDALFPALPFGERVGERGEGENLQGAQKKVREFVDGSLNCDDAKYLQGKKRNGLL